MFQIIKSEDSKVLSSSGFVKNAIFYKDMFAFYDAYEKLTTDFKNSLPNFCFEKKKEFCLEGLCLAMKMYASELGFETVKLTADYLRVLYFTICAYSTDSKTVDKAAIEIEYEEYKKASRQVVESAQSQIAEVEKVYNEKKKKHDEGANKYARKLILSHVYNVLFIVSLITGIFVAGVAMAFNYMGMIELTTAVIWAVSLFVGIELLAVLFRILSKKNEEYSHDNAYLLQNLKKDKDAAYEEYRVAKDKSNRIISEKYEFMHSFSNAIGKFYDRLSMEEIVEKMAEYKLLSYNIKEDVKSLFENQQRQIRGLVQNILSLNHSSKNQEFVDIYNEITKQDWLYYNLEIRFNFLKKFIDAGEKHFSWELVIDGNRVNPFGIDAKTLAKEEIAYLKSKDSLFVSSTLDKFLNTKYAKNLNALELKGNLNAEALKNVKVAYINHFYNHENVKTYDNLFYTTKFADGLHVTNEILDENEHIPVCAMLKIRILENAIGLSNSESFAIKQIIGVVNAAIGEEVIEQEIETITEEDIVYPVYECQKIEDVNSYMVRYMVNDNVVVGYRPRPVEA